MNDQVETSTLFISDLEDDIILFKIKPNADIDLESSIKSYDATMKFAKGKKYAALVDARVTMQVSAEAREYGSQKEQQKHMIAQALLVNSLANKLIGNFIIKFNKPYAPTKLFSDEKEALIWLRKQVLKSKLSTSSSMNYSS